MGPPENLTRRRKRQAAGRRKRAPRPRMRRCLLKGCEQGFHPRQAGQRYCSEECRKAARKWSRWKAQQKYRTTVTGKAKRNRQSRCYRERVKARKPPEAEPVNATARVITPEDFFRAQLRPARLLREIRTPAAKSFAALLFACMPARYGASAAAGAALETGADLIRTY
jgi:hypothetical protein